MARHREYWESFYGGRERADVPDEPSGFARWADDLLHPGSAVLDVGTGTARDALWLAARGRTVLGVDYATAAVTTARATAQQRGLDATFETLDLEDADQVGSLADRLAADPGQPWSLYGRFLVHAIEDAGRGHLWQLAAAVTAGRGRLLLEFRTDEDAGAAHAFGEHFRRFLAPDDVAAELVAAGAEIEHLEAGRGLAVYRDEDPVVCRLVARWPDEHDEEQA